MTLRPMPTLPSATAIAASMNSLPKALRSYCVSAVFKIRPAFILLIAFAASNLTGGSRIPSAIAGQNTQRATSALPVATEARALAGYRRLPLSFEPNVGQSDSSVDFLSRASGYTLFLSGGEAVLSLQGQTRKKSPELVPDLVKSNHPQKAHSATVLRMSKSELPRHERNWIASQRNPPYPPVAAVPCALFAIVELLSIECENV